MTSVDVANLVKIGEQPQTLEVVDKARADFLNATIQSEKACNYTKFLKVEGVDEIE